MSSLKVVNLFDADDRPIDGLVSVHSPEDSRSLHENAVVRQVRAKPFDIIDYVFFRRFSVEDGRHIRSSQILAYVVDNRSQKHNNDRLAQLHHDCWLQGLVPLIYIAWPARVDILSCARKPDFWNESLAKAEYIPAETVDVLLTVAAEISDAISKRQRLSAHRLLDGTFWEDATNQRLAKEEAAAHRRLIRAIVEADGELDGAKNPVLRRLLVLMVLITYLEDRRVFPKGLFARYQASANSFRELLKMGSVDEVTRLLRDLEKKFNGDVFSLPEGGESLTPTELDLFAKLVEGKTLGKQQHFWELFDFEHIPVEVISRLYQRFVTGHGAVYTPPMLVSLILDRVMPYDRIAGDERVLDPSCGSGIFLVGAFKRLVIHWRSRHEWQLPTVEVLKSILAHSIHGVEMESAAVDLTAFSLALALCDFLRPNVIWSSLKFDKLRGRNLCEGDYFDPTTFIDENNHEWPANYDIIVGNPPFESKLTTAGKAIAGMRAKDLPKVPDSNSAYLFLEQGLQTLTDGGGICLIQPHGLLYNSNTADFRGHLMRLARLNTILDFVSIRGLFDGADPKTIAWYAIREGQGTNDGVPVNHLTFRRTYSVAEQISFEIDHYDWHSVSRIDAFEDEFVWRMGLLGGGRLLEISRHLRQLKTLSEFVKDRRWTYGEGFIVGNRAIESQWLRNLPFLPTKQFKQSGLVTENLEPVDKTHFEAPRSLELFSPPLLLIKENSTLPVAFWEQGPLAYLHSIVGIHAAQHERDALFAVFSILQERKRFYRFYCTLNDTRALIGKATSILKRDIDRIPMPDDVSELDLAFWEDTLKEDVLDYMADYVRLGQDSMLLKMSANEMHVRNYSALFVKMLGSIYRNLNAADPIFLNGLIAQPFYFGNKPDVDWLRQLDGNVIEQLIYDNSRKNLQIVRVARYYEQNVILIVKPDRLRYWIKSTAIRDADDTLVDLHAQGW